MPKIEVSYNTDRDTIRFPEYGRTVQELLLHAKTIADDQKRQRTVESIIQLMMMLNPSPRNTEEYRDKLWNHAFAIANYELNVQTPSYVVIRPDNDRAIQSLPYPAVAKEFRHYGNHIQTLIQKAIDMEEGAKKEGFVEVIASYMKLAYKTWNREHYVSDDAVKDDLELLSKGRLALHEGHSSLDTLSIGASKRDREQQMRNRNNKNNKNRNNKNKHNNQGGRNKRKK